MKSHPLFRLIVAAPAVSMLMDTAYAASVQYNLCPIQKEDDSSKSHLCLSVTIKDLETDKVTVKLEASGLTASQHIDTWYLNLDGGINRKELSFGNRSKEETFSNPTFLIGGSDGKDGFGNPYDIKIDFTNDPKNLFGADTEYSFTISGKGLSSKSFEKSDSQSSSEEQGLSNYATCHITDDHSDKEHQDQVYGGGSAPTPITTAVPEPSAGIYSLLTASAVFALSRKRRDMKA